MRIVYLTIMAMFFVLTQAAVLAEQAPEAAAPKLSKLERVGELVQENRQKNPVKTVEAKGSESSEVKSGGMKMFQGLAFCVGILLMGSALAKKFQGKKPKGFSSKRIQIIERAAITSRTSLVLAEIDGQRIVLTAGADQVSTIALGESVQNIAGFDKEVETACKEEIRLSA